MKTISFLVLGTNFHFDEKTGQIVRPLFQMAFHTEFCYDEFDIHYTDKLLDFYADQVCSYDHAVVINMVDGHISAYKKLREDNTMYVRDRLFTHLLTDAEGFKRFVFDSSKF